MTSLGLRLLPFAAALSLAAPSYAAPAMWEVRDDDSAIWLFGSIHVLPQEVIWRTPLFEQIFAEADKVVFETDIGPTAAAQIGAQAMVRGIYVDGTLLTDIMDDETEAQLRLYANAASLPVGTLLAMRPWMAANTISVATMVAEGYDAHGVESVLQPELAADRTGYLETGEEQLAVLADAPEDEQLAMLEATLDEMDTLPKLLEKMLSSWLEGAPEALSKMFEVEMGGFEEAYLDRLIYARNRNWIAPLEAMLASNEQSFVIVGAGHLVGDGSVIDLLKQAGYEIERIQ